MEKNKQSVYVATNELGRLKIGVSENVPRRMRQLQNSGGVAVNLEAVYHPHYINAQALERRVHQSLVGQRTDGEWFEGVSVNDALVRIESLDTPTKSFKKEINMNLAKVVVAGERLNLAKEQAGVNKFAVGLEWNQKKGIEADCDLSVMLLDADGKPIPGTNGKNKPKSLCFYLQQELPGVKSYGDNRTGEDDLFATPTGNDEQIDIDFSQLEKNVAQVVVIATTHSEVDGKPGNPLPFGRVAQPTLTIFGNEAATPAPLYTFEMDEDFSTATAVEVAKFYLRSGEWRYVSMGDEVGTESFGLMGIIKKYGI